jgi:hypothetical protein
MMINWNAPLSQQALHEALMNSWRDPFSWMSTIAWINLYHRTFYAMLLFPAFVSLTLLDMSAPPDKR